MKEFFGKRTTKVVPFMDGEIEIKALTVGEVKSIDRKTKVMQKKKEEDQNQLEILSHMVRLSVVGAEKMTEKEFESLPLEEVKKLSNTIMGVDEDENEGKE